MGIDLNSGVHTRRLIQTGRKHLAGADGPREIDIWKLRLDGTGKDSVRVTNFNDYQGWKASKPAISTDGRYAAFQIARTRDEAGVGYGIILLQLDHVNYSSPNTSIKAAAFGEISGTGGMRVIQLNAKPPGSATVGICNHGL